MRQRHLRDLTARIGGSPNRDQGLSIAAYNPSKTLGYTTETRSRGYRDLTPKSKTEAQRGPFAPNLDPEQHDVGVSKSYT